MDGENNGKPSKMDDLGIPLFLEIPISHSFFFKACFPTPEISIRRKEEKNPKFSGKDRLPNHHFPRGELLNLGGAYPELVETKKNHEPQKHQPCLPCSSSAFVLDFLNLGSSSSSQSFVQLDALMLAVGHMHLEILMPLKSYLEIGDV